MVVLTEQIVRGKTRVEHLDEVKSLNLWGQDIDDVSVLLQMPAVEVLSLSVNRIGSLRDFRRCLRLQELYLRKNQVADINDLQYLVPMTDLKVLWLCDNPCADHPLYRQLVAALLPSVEKLDNADVTPQDRDAARNNPDVAGFVSMLSRLVEGGPAPRATAPTPGALPPAPQDGPSGNAIFRTQSGKQAAAPPILTPAPSSDARQRRRKNVLYAVMALVTELDMEDLVYVKREIEQRLGLSA